MAAGATVPSILGQISKQIADTQQVIDALTANPVVTQGQLDQISNNLDVLQSNINIIKVKLGIPVTLVTAPKPSTDIFGG